MLHILQCKCTAASIAGNLGRTSVDAKGLRVWRCLLRQSVRLSFRLSVTRQAG